jgi:hypothetical protein
MLGWNTSVYRQRYGKDSPATFESPKGERMAVWQTGMYGLRWIKDLAKAGVAIDLGGNGYPCRLTAPAKHILPQIRGGSPPEANDVWGCDENDTLLESWVGKTKVETSVMAQCTDDEWLLIVAWDES